MGAGQPALSTERDETGGRFLSPPVCTDERSVPASRQEPGQEKPSDGGARPRPAGQRRAPPAKRQQRPRAAAASSLASAGPGCAGLAARCGAPLGLAPHSCLLTGSLNVGAAGSPDASPPGSAPDGL